MSRKVFCGASNPFMTGMASGRGFEARRWGAFRAARPEGARCRRGRGAPCARLPLPLPLGAAAAAFLLRTPKLSALDSAPPRRTPPPSPRARFFPPGSARASHVVPHGEGQPATPSTLSASLLWGSGQGASSPWGIRDTPTWSLGRGVGRGLNNRHAPSRGGHASHVGPWLLLVAPPHGFPRGQPTLGMVSGPQCRLLDLQHPQLPALQGETARAKEASFADGES